MWRRLFFIWIFIFITYQKVCCSENKKILADKYYQEGIKLCQIGNTDSAITLFKKALKYNRKLADAHNQLALIYMDQGTVHSRFIAGLELEKALKLDWNNPEYRFNKAILYLKKDMAGSALREFKKVIKLDPKNFKAYYHLGNVRRMQQRWSEAISCYRRAVDLDPDFAAAHNDLGVTLGTTGRHEEAMAHFLEALRIDPDHADARLNVARARAALGQPPAAEE